MGLDRRIIRVLDHARAGGVDFDRTVMIGRQQVHLSEREFREAARECGLPSIDALAKRLFEEHDRYAEPLLEAMGATVVDSVDASDYEDANMATIRSTRRSSHVNSWFVVSHWRRERFGRKFNAWLLPIQ